MKREFYNHEAGVLQVVLQPAFWSIRSYSDGLYGLTFPDFTFARLC